MNLEKDITKKSKLRREMVRVETLDLEKIHNMVEEACKGLAGVICKSS